MTIAGSSPDTLDDSDRSVAAQTAIVKGDPLKVPPVKEAPYEVAPDDGDERKKDRDPEVLARGDVEAESGENDEVGAKAYAEAYGDTDRDLQDALELALPEANFHGPGFSP